jgi:hypothetical protein
MKEFTVYDRVTGEIAHCGVCQDEAYALQAVEKTHEVVEGIFDPNETIFIDRTPRPKIKVEPSKEYLETLAKLSINDATRSTICATYPIEKQLSLLMKAIALIAPVKNVPEGLDTILGQFNTIQGIVDKSNIEIASLDSIETKEAMYDTIGNYETKLKVKT